MWCFLLPKFKAFIKRGFVVLELLPTEIIWVDFVVRQFFLVISSPRVRVLTDLWNFPFIFLFIFEKLKPTNIYSSTANGTLSSIWERLIVGENKEFVVTFIIVIVSFHSQTCRYLLPLSKTFFLKFRELLVCILSCASESVQ